MQRQTQIVKCFVTLALCIPVVSFHAHSFASSPLTVTRAANTNVEETSDNLWLNHGLLFSSFSDGLSQNSQGKTFLKEGLAKALLLEQCTRTEDQVKSSVLASPCNGPNVELLSDLEDVDAKLKQVRDHADPMSLVSSSSSSSSLELRLVYIPTAMYALRPESNRTPGKQRQRARADGKKRRNNIVQLLTDLVAPSGAVVRAVTLDLDDGSIKQPQGPSGGDDDEGLFPFPSNGKQALTTWKPHMVYVEGGNTFWLTHCMEKGDWSDLIVQVAAQSGTVYCGSSAGAILVGQNVETACWKGWDDPRIVPGRESPQNWQGVPGLGMVGKASFFPHMDDSWNDLVAEKKQTLTHVECLYEEAVLCVRGEEKSWSMSPGTPISSAASEKSLVTQQL